MAIEGVGDDSKVGSAPDGQKPDGQKPDAAKPDGQKQEPNPGTRTGQPNNGQGDDDPRYKGLLAETQKERAARQALEKQVKDLVGKLEGQNKHLRRAAGVEDVNEADQEVEEIKARLLQVMPGLAKLSDAKLDRLLAMVDTLEETTQHYWGKHGLNSLQGVEKKIAESFGDLSDRQVKAVRAAFVTEVEMNPEFAKQYKAEPEKVIEQFAKDWIEDWFDSSKRRITAQELERNRRVPGARDRNLTTGVGQKPIDVNDPKAVEDVLVAGFRSRGNEFGRR